MAMSYSKRFDCQYPDVCLAPRPADLAELSLAIFDMRDYPSSHQTAGFACSARSGCAILMVGMDPTYSLTRTAG
jgi:hypothetical protein